MKKIYTQYTVRLVKEKASKYDEKYKKANKPEALVELLDKIYDFESLTQEKIVIVTTDLKLQVTGIFEVAKGGLSQCYCPIQAIMQRALLSNAWGIFLVHNHLSGNTEPSKEDIITTKNLVKACNILGIELVDHIVVYNSVKYTSLKENGYV